MKMMYYPEGAEDTVASLVSLTREFGSNPEYVLAGGGNSSCKVKNTMFVKASGTNMGSIDRSGFVEVSLEKLNSIWDTRYPEDKDAREEAVLKDLLASKIDPEAGRPSVETLLHALFPYRFVMHTHPALVNGLTCSHEGESAAGRMFGESMVWIPVTDPGYILALKVKEAVEAHQERYGLFPQMILLQNHGIFVAADTEPEIRSIYDRVFEKLRNEVGFVLADDYRILQDQESITIRDAVRSKRPDLHCLIWSSPDMELFLRSRESFEPLSMSITPDHIVYAGYRPLWVESPDELEMEVEKFEEEEGFFPRIVAVKNRGVIECQDSESKAETAGRLFRDNMKIARYAEAFGGVCFMPKKNVDFIRNWEVEKYRASRQS